MFTVPNNLLTTNSAKTIKGNKKGYTTYIMYLAPFNLNHKGINLCSHASAGCASACLFQSGNARFPQIQQARVNKSNYFVSNRQMFMEQLLLEISLIDLKHRNLKTETKTLFKDFAIRLNGTSDISFDKFLYSDGLNIFQKFPHIQFYDYTKNINMLKRVKEMGLTNYHITFSRSETNEKDCIEALSMGYNVAVVFKDTPETYLGYKTIDGDTDDLRFLDDNNSIVSLKYKRSAIKGSKQINEEALRSGFVVNEAV